MPFDVTGGSDVGLEHEVEFDGAGELVACGRVSDVVLLDELAKLRTSKVVDLPSAQLWRSGIRNLPGQGSTRTLQQLHPRA